MRCEKIIEKMKEGKILEMWADETTPISEIYYKDGKWIMRIDGKDEVVDYEDVVRDIMCHLYILEHDGY